MYMKTDNTPLLQTQLRSRNYKPKKSFISVRCPLPEHSDSPCFHLRYEFLCSFHVRFLTSCL